MAGLAQFDPTSNAMEEMYAIAAFQSMDRGADRGRGQVQGLRSACKVFALSHSDENAQVGPGS